MVESCLHELGLRPVPTPGRHWTPSFGAYLDKVSIVELAITYADYRAKANPSRYCVMLKDFFKEINSTPQRSWRVIVADAVSRALG